MSLKQTVYCHKCYEVNLVPARTGKDFNCVRCGQSLENPLEPYPHRPRPERQSPRFASSFLNVVIVMVATCSYALVAKQGVIPVASEPEVRVWRGGKLDRDSRLAFNSGTVTGRASVIDGDTIEIRGVRVRLWGIDAPEGSQRCTNDGKPWRCGTDSADALDAFLRGRTVTCGEKDRDRYGRMVAVCRADGEDIGAMQVKKGWALDYTRYSSGAYASEQRSAENQRVGMWQGKFEPPWEWRRR